MSSTDTPVEIRAPRGARVLEVDWPDGSCSKLPHQVLRGFCPCAQCQGHQGPIQWVEGVDRLPDATLEILELEEVGHYALQVTWADGHQTGIYSFSYLRELGQLEGASPEALRSAQFSR